MEVVPGVGRWYQVFDPYPLEFGAWCFDLGALNNLEFKHLVLQIFGALHLVVGA